MSDFKVTSGTFNKYISAYDKQHVIQFLKTIISPVIVETLTIEQCSGKLVNVILDENGDLEATISNSKSLKYWENAIVQGDLIRFNKYKGTKGDLEWNLSINNSSFDKFVKISQEFVNHSPDGVSWGYNGSGCAQFALAMLIAETWDTDFALENYMDFKNKFISKLPNNFEVNSIDIRQCLEGFTSK